MEKRTLVHSRELRKNPTMAERCLWRHLRRRQVFEHKFRRQHPIGPFIVDFVCLEKKLIVELDGGQHLEQERYDSRRSRYLQERGYRVLRFWDNQVFLEMQGILRTIEYALSVPPGTKMPSTGEEPPS